MQLWGLSRKGQTRVAGSQNGRRENATDSDCDAIMSENSPKEKVSLKIPMNQEKMNKI